MKAYTSERKENLVFARGAHTLLRNVAQAVTGVSAITAFSSVITGAIGTLMIVIGGRAVLAGEMTLGDLIMYVLFTGWMITPLVQMASIGTQITEAFAGLDRIREIRAMATEADRDVGRTPMSATDGHVSFEDVWFAYEEDSPVLKGVSLDAPPGRRRRSWGPRVGEDTLVSLVLSSTLRTRGGF